MRFAFPSGRLFGVRYFFYYPYYGYIQNVSNKYIRMTKAQSILLNNPQTIRPVFVGGLKHIDNACLSL